MKPQKILTAIIGIPRYAKRLIIVSFDIIISLICTFGILAIVERDHIHIFTSQSIIVSLILLLLQIGALWYSGTYLTVSRYLSLKSIATSSMYLLTMNVIIFFVFSLYGIENTPFALGTAQPALFFSFFLGSRFLVALIFSSGSKDTSFKTLTSKIAIIYGAGEAGRQLAIALNQSREFEVAAFIDDDFSLQNAIIQSVKVFSFDKLEKIINEKEITHILVALPTSRIHKLQIINKLSVYGVKVMIIPTLSELAEGRLTISDLKEVQIEDLLAREITSPNELLLSKVIRDQSIMITGAGGTIGSELCRQIIKRYPKKIILIEINELALYEIQNELLNIKNKYQLSVQIVSKLCDIKDKGNINYIIKNEAPTILFHTAAYKHVPLVEENICEGIINNVMGTLNCIEGAINNKVLKFILISTDKAVRPTNVMGASKRVAELITQAYADSQKNTKITMVRFGNVLGSSGSVVPRFRQQIAAGGPITLTHKDITRYFMTIPEATQLLMQAGSMGGNGEVYLLDMGEPVKIYELAKRMIELSGLKIKNNQNQGDIEIKITGLRPGEKLYEELLISNNPIPTEHPEIFMGIENFIKIDILLNKIEKVLDLCLNNDHINSKMELYEILKYADKNN
jgi:FlaA1/EpsC-like NDP-sugar epimerase